MHVMKSHTATTATETDLAHFADLFMLPANFEPSQMLLFTPHGSTLYGLAHENSDKDFYLVTSNNAQRTRQRLHDEIDLVVVGLSKFLQQCDAGVPQALEAMFSGFSMSTGFDAYRAGYRVNTAHMAKTYRRTMRNFAQENFKRRRHAFRLAFNLGDALTYGRFNPTLTHEQQEYATWAAGEDNFYDLLRDLSPVELPEDLFAE